MLNIKKIAVCFLSAAVCVIGSAAAASEIAENTPLPEIRDGVTQPIEGAQNSEASDSLNPDIELISGGTEGSPESQVTDTPEQTVQPEQTEQPAEENPFLTTKLNVELKMNTNPNKFPIGANVLIDIYNTAGELVTNGIGWVDKSTESITYHFEIPEYCLGETYRVRLVSGLQTLKLNGETIGPGGELTLQTYGYKDENGQIVSGNTFSLEGELEYETDIYIYTNNTLMNLTPRARLVDDYTMIPIRQVAEAIGLKVNYDASSDSVTCSVGNKSITFYAGTTSAVFFGEPYTTAYPTRYIDGSLYIPVRPMAEAFGCTVEALDFGDHFDVIIGPSPMVKEFRESSPVNSLGISSRTPYLIWISKSEYKVRVYLGEQYNWELINTFDCAIGAPNTPTITGQYEYIERLSSWDYDTYYVGPVMRFYNGYALHSTLLYYGGGEYDGRVGVKISHGCVRLHPEDINWLVSYVPIGTKIYITE